MRRDVVLCAILAAALSVVWIWPQLIHLRKLPDRGDPVFSAWRLARVAHQLGSDPAHLFDGNIFYPRQWTLAYSDATLLQGVLGAPFILAGADPLVVSNALFVAAYPLCALAFFYAGWRLTHSALAALIAGVLGAWHPFHGEHFSHLELQWFMFAPLAFVAALETVDDPTWHRGLLLSGLVALQSLASMYLGLMLVTALAPLVVVAAWLRAPAVKRLAVAAAGFVVVAAPIAALLSVPYRQARADHGERTVSEIEQGSARPADYLSTSRRLAAYRWHARAANIPERELFPGTSTLVLAATGVAAPAAVSVPLVAAAAATFDWSLGRHGLTYRGLSSLLPPYRSVRVPARFAVLLGTILILLAAAGIGRMLARRTRRTQIAVTAAIVGVTALDLSLRLELLDYYPAVPAFHDRLGPTAVVAALPAGHEVDYMYFSTRRWNQLLTGYSGFIPLDATLDAALADVSASSSLDALRARGATHLTYVCAFERSAQRCEYTMRQLARRAEVELVAEETWQGAPARLYRFR